MDESYLLATVRYVERNPVVAKLCYEIVNSIGYKEFLVGTNWFKSRNHNKKLMMF
jgi:hypothetical protein